MSLIRLSSLITGALLLFAALGISTQFNALRVGITFGVLFLSALAFSQKYPMWGFIFIGGVILFNPIFPVHFVRHLWVIIDIVSIATISYFSYWSTDSHQKGARFEEYVSSLFPEPQFTIKDRTRDISKFANRRVESDTHPDFVFKNNKNGKTFAIECKWRHDWAQNKVGQIGLYWTKRYTDTYKQFEQETGTQVIIAFGIGGTPQSPRETYFLNLARLNGTFINKSIIASGKTTEMINESM